MIDKIIEQSMVDSPEFFRTGSLSRKYQIRDLAKGMMIYGWVCSECDEEWIFTLEFHVNRDVGSHMGYGRAENSIEIARRVAKAGKILDDVELLCGNCHKLADIRDRTGKRGMMMYEAGKLLENEPEEFW